MFWCPASSLTYLGLQYYKCGLRIHSSRNQFALLPHYLKKKKTKWQRSPGKKMISPPCSPVGPALPCMQANASWPAAQSSCPDSPCWSPAACSLAPPTCPMPAPTPAWPVTPGASTRRRLTCWCGVSKNQKKHNKLIMTSFSSCNFLQNHHFVPQAGQNTETNCSERKKTLVWKK